MNIDKMEAGPIMDVLFAEKVLKWKWDHSNPLQSLLFSPDGDLVAAKFPDDSDVHPLYPLPYSTNDSLAMQALNDFRTPFRIISDSSSIVVQLTMRKDKHTYDVFGYGNGLDELPLAISRALLKAVTE